MLAVTPVAAQSWYSERGRFKDLAYSLAGSVVLERGKRGSKQLSHANAFVPALARGVYLIVRQTPMPGDSLKTMSRLFPKRIASGSSLRGLCVLLFPNGSVFDMITHPIREEFTEVFLNRRSPRSRR
jgi:hypothetical protein